MKMNPAPMRSILLAEDDPRDVELTCAALQEHHLANRVVVVRDGEEALDYLFCRKRFATRDGGDPIVVILDLKMPRMGGLQLLKTIKADERLRHIPVVVLSSSGESPDLVECYKHGVNAYVVKPVEISAFMEAVGRLGIFWAAINEPPTFSSRNPQDTNVTASWSVDWTR